MRRLAPRDLGKRQEDKMAKALTEKELKKLNSGQVVKLAERLKIAGFTKMSRAEMETAIMDAAKAKGKVISTDIVPPRGAKDDRTPPGKEKDPPKAKPVTERDSDIVECLYIGAGGVVTVGSARYSPGQGVRMTRIEAHVLRHRFPQRFRINEIV